jgi:hypothetical protein
MKRRGSSAHAGRHERSNGSTTVAAKRRLVKFSPVEMAYDLPEETDFSKLIPIIGRGIVAAEMRGAGPLKAKYVVADEASLALSLDDGRRLTAPLDWYPRLKHATPAERNDLRLIMGRRAVLWQALGLGVSVKALLEGTKANESAASLKKWLAGRTADKRRKTA